MKILTISDVVVDLVQSPVIAQRFADIDLVLSCGDLPFSYLEYVVTMLNKRLYYVYGNHASHNILAMDGSYKSEPEGCENIHRRVVNHEGLLIAGLEGSMRYRPGEHQYSQSEMKLLTWSLAPRFWWNTWRYGRAIDILITHAPPAGIHDGNDLCHQGFDAFLSLMDRYKPRYLIHGHTHLYRSDAKRVTRYKDTIVLNTYGYQVIEIDDATLGPRR
ncbi:MAG: metallophosphoesterase [Chloroflexi bacterium]|jgi:Icc-related predicted phosphoesterase|nr:metallophosphoesterase [Chloroflexota bacterium]